MSFLEQGLHKPRSRTMLGWQESNSDMKHTISVGTVVAVLNEKRAGMT
jgi:hypothetical protein